MPESRLIFSPTETCKIVGCKLSYLVSLERSRTFLPHRDNVNSSSNRELVYYDKAQVELLKIISQLRFFVVPKYMKNILKQKRSLAQYQELLDHLRNFEANL
jgi:hypothetical protein